MQKCIIFFSQAHLINWGGVEHSAHTTVEKRHGRIETREIKVIEDLEWLPQRSSWKNLTSLIEVSATREYTNGKKQETATRFYISSCQGTAADFASWVRDHWSVENDCHWKADVIFVKLCGYTRYPSLGLTQAYP